MKELIVGYFSRNLVFAVFIISLGVLLCIKGKMDGVIWCGLATAIYGTFVAGKTYKEVKGTQNNVQAP